LILMVLLLGVCASMLISAVLVRAFVIWVFVSILMFCFLNDRFSSVDIVLSLIGTMWGRSSMMVILLLKCWKIDVNSMLMVLLFMIAIDVGIGSRLPVH